MGKFLPGQEKPENSGRQKGSPNRRTLLLQETLEELDIDVPERIVKLLPELSAEKQVEVLLELMQYLYPRRKALEVYDHTPKEPEFELTQEQMVEMAKEILYSEKQETTSLPDPDSTMLECPA